MLVVWQNGGPGSHIPISSKRTVRRRQNNCCAVYDPLVCTGEIDQFDHIVNVKALRVDRKLANDPDLLQGLCLPCHKRKTQAEAQAGRRKHLRKPKPHPGLIQNPED
jgi:5-methylcytosine-specific restriction endonuclease McrA